jgi:hypothetical protein
MKEARFLEHVNRAFPLSLIVDGADDFVEQSSARCLRHVFVAALVH